MSDIAPKPIAAPSGVLPALPNATPAATNTATAAEIPAAVANLSVGTFITGTVIERNPRGLVTIRTDKGTIKLQTPVPLKTGSTITLQLQSVGAQVQLSILSIDGQPVATASAKPGAPQIRPDTLGKPAPDTTQPRAASAQPGATVSHAVIGDDGHEATTIRQTSTDRSAPERGMTPRATAPSTTAPAASFVARPLAQIGSAGLEALSSPPTPSTPSPTPNATNPALLAPAPPTPIITVNTATTMPPVTVPLTTTVQPASPAIAQTLAPQSPAMTNPAAPANIMTPATSTPAATTVAANGTVPPATAIPLAAPTIATTVIVPGGQFTAAIMTPAPGMVDAVPDQRIASAPSGSRALPNAPPLANAAMPSAMPATVPMPAPMATATPSPTPSTVPGDQVILRLLGMESPQTAPSSLANMSAAPADPRAAPGVTVPNGALTTVGTIVDGPDVPQALTQIATATTQVQATAANAAKTWIATPFGLLSAPGPAPGPAGTRLLLEVVLRGESSSIPLQPLSTASSGPLPVSLTAADKTWPALRDIMTAVQTIAPDAAEHLANVTLPRIGPNLAAGMMAFVAAARQANPRAWLGEQTVDSLLRSGHGHLIDRLGDDFALATRVAAETAPHGWQTLLVPLYDGERLNQIRFYWQRQKRKAEQRKPSTRFVVEAEMTNLGVLQLDGMYDKPQFDLVVRTSTSLPGPIRSDIIDIFGDALLATNLKGAVSFQTNASLRAGALAGVEPATDAGIGLIV